jgi:RNA polymerase sigma-70 factor, ECF subfamily
MERLSAPAPSTAEAGWIDRLRAGDAAATEALVKDYYGPLRGYFLRMVGGNLPEAEDLVQETFIRVLKYKGCPPFNFKTWIYTIARNLAYDRFRSARYRHEQFGLNNDWLDEVEENDLSRDMDPVEDHVMDHLAFGSVRNMLEKLPANQREMVVMRFYQDLKLEEIAAITGSPLGTVKSRLFHALKRLKKILEEVDHAKQG